MSVYAKTIIDTTTHKNSLNGYNDLDGYQYVILNQDQKKQLVKAASLFLKDSSYYFTGHLVRNTSLIVEEELVITEDGSGD